MSTVKNRFIGTGITYPIELNSSGRPNYTNSIDLIKSSISMVIYWSRNTRFMNQKFGSRIHEILEEPDDSVSRSLLRFFVKESLEEWEKRIEIIDVDIQNPSDARVDIKIIFQIRNTKEEETYIFPFYKDIIY